MSFDNAANIFNQTSNVAFTISAPVAGGAPALSYDAAADLLTIGTSSVVVLSPTPDFLLFIANASTEPTFQWLYYSQFINDQFAISISRTGELAPSGVPEPASLTLLGLGLAGVGARRWRQRRSQ